MKAVVPGKTPMERLSNLTRRVIAVRKADVERADSERKRRKRLRKRT